MLLTEGRLIEYFINASRNTLSVVGKLTSSGFAKPTKGLVWSGPPIHDIQYTGERNCVSSVQRFT